jgi:hypothetical protein
MRLPFAHGGATRSSSAVNGGSSGAPSPDRFLVLFLGLFDPLGPLLGSPIGLRSSRPRASVRRSYPRPAAE